MRVLRRDGLPGKSFLFLRTHLSVRFLPLRVIFLKLRLGSQGLCLKEKGGTITINGIRQQILYFIKEADPDSVPTAHQVRALATSVNFFQFMDFQALTHYTGWKSSKVFMKHYFKNIDALKFHAVAAGKIVSPSLPSSSLNCD